METGTKVILSFLTGAALGAAGVCYLNHNKADFSQVKSFGTDLLTRGLNLKDAVMARVNEMREDFDDMAAEARDRVDAAKLARAEEASGNQSESKPA